MRKKIRKLSFSFAEVIVGAALLAIVFGGLLAAFVGARRYVSRANQRLIAVNFTRQTLNRLYTHVRQDTWDTGYLSTPEPPWIQGAGESNYTSSPGNLTVGTDHTLSYDIQTFPERQYREVTAQTTY